MPPLHLERVVFSLADGLCRHQPEQRIAALAQAASVSAARADSAVDNAFIERCDSGVYNLEQMLTRIRQRLDADLTHAHLMGLWSLAYQPDIDVIRRAQSRRVRTKLALLCNGSPLLEQALPAYLPEVDQLVAEAFYSHAFGRLETDPDLFAAVGEQLASPAASLLYVSDKAAARDAATRAGWRATTASGMDSAMITLD